VPDVQVKTREGGATTLKDDTVQRLKENLRGKRIRPEDTGRNEARQVYNAMHDRRPALIVHAAGVADLIAAIKFARDWHPRSRRRHWAEQDNLSIFPDRDRVSGRPVKEIAATYLFILASLYVTVTSPSIR
jgi:hypothetical protein